MPIYNLPGVTTPAEVHRPLLADIFLGKITKWNDAGIAKLNAGVTLPTTRHHRRPPLRWQRHHVHLVRLPGEGVAGMEDARSASTPPSTGRWAWAAKATTASQDW